MDDDLVRFAGEGAPSLPAGRPGWVERNGARVWFCAFGEGPPVVLLHGGLGHSGNWGYQVPALTARGWTVIAVDTRGHGRSTRDGRAFSYQLLADDVRAVLDTLGLEKAALVGWSDGACTALVLADQTPDRVKGVLFFACNMDSTGTHETIAFGPVLERCVTRHRLDYQTLSATPDDFDAFSDAVGRMQRTQPEYTAADLARINVPVLVVLAEHDEFIRADHARYLARTLPQAEFLFLPGVSHFAPLQRPELFNQTVLTFLEGLR